MVDAKLCPKCNGSMASGTLRNRGQFGGDSPHLWAPTDDAPFPLAGAPTRRADIVIYRCGQCGYLEMYATSTS
jgi:predicted nucleic-acid-binding Zn-ribbon protein